MPSLEPPSSAAGGSGRGVWAEAPAVRGEIIEKQLGQNLPQTFPVIDKFVDGVATSIKSMDLNAVTYADPAAITRTGQGYINKVADFTGGARSNFVITQGQITGRALELAVPEGATAPQEQALQGMIRYGRSKGVTVTIVVVQ